MWEDCNHRIEELNKLLSTVEELEENLKAAKLLIDAEDVSEADKKDRLKTLLLSLNKNLKQYQHNPPANAANLNRLDVNMRRARHHQFHILSEHIESTIERLESKKESDHLLDILVVIEDYSTQIKGLCFEVYSLFINTDILLNYCYFTATKFDS